MGDLPLIFRSLFSALPHGAVVAIIGFIIVTVFSILGGIVAFVISLLARTEELAAIITTLIVIILIATSMAGWAQTLRYAASMAGYRRIDRMPPFGAAWLASTVAAILLTIGLLIVLALVAFLILLSLGLAPQLWEQAFDETFWQSVFNPESAMMWVVVSIALSNVTTCCWTMILTPIICGPSNRPGAYSMQMILARVFVTVPFFTAAALGLAYLLTSPALVSLIQTVKPGATTMDPIIVASLFPGWLGMGWIMSFEVLLLASLPIVSKAELRAFDDPTPTPAREDIRALRKKWQDQS